jgi:NADH dehydrogenase FAD-containing subunit
MELATGETVKTHTLVWAPGLMANPIVHSLVVELAHGGRIPVGPDLQMKLHTGIQTVTITGVRGFSRVQTNTEADSAWR